jgi:hypothetical protein
VTGKFNVLIDAQRGEFYRAGYTNQNGDRAGTHTPLELISVATVRELASKR